MSYTTHPELAESPGALELSQVASDEQRKPVAADLLDALLRGNDTSDWAPHEVDQAQAAIDRIDAVVTEAGAIIDGYLAKRGYKLPLDPVPDLVSSWCRSIARYLLHKNRRQVDEKDPIYRVYRDTLRMLALTADGKFSLGADDGVANDKLDARFASARPVFSRHRLRGWN